MSGDLADFDEMDPQRQAAALLDALENDPDAVDAMLRARPGLPGVVRPENSGWSHGSGWDVNPERRRGDPI